MNLFCMWCGAQFERENDWWEHLGECGPDVICAYCGVRPVDAAGRSCTECDDMLAGCDPGNE